MACLEVYQVTKADRIDTPRFTFLIDDDDLPKIEQYKWYVHYQKKPNNVVRVSCRGKIEGRFVYLHRFLMGVNDPTAHVDHIDNDVFNCRKHNLRVVTAHQNMQNRPKPVTNKTGVKGLSYNESTGIYTAQITAYGQSHRRKSRDRQELETWLRTTREALHGAYARHE
jgi:hypothetical protein